MKRKLLIIAFLICSTIFGFVCYSIFSFDNVVQVPFYKATQKSWSHRGIAYTEKEENTLTSIKRAIQKGYAGIEIDIWYRNNKFYVTHNKSFNDSSLTLESVFLQFPKVLFWLDLKNLSLNNATEISKQLSIIAPIKDNYIIESKNALALALLNNNKHYTSLWLTPKNEPLIFLFTSYKGMVELKNMIFIRWVDFNAISMNAKYYTKNIRKRYSNLNIHCWTDRARNSKAYKKLVNIKEVKIILDDQEFHKKDNSK